MNIEQKESLIVFSKEQFVLKLYHLKGDLYRIRITDYDKLDSKSKMDANTFFKAYCATNSIQILTEEHKHENAFLIELGFSIYRSKFLFRKNLEKPIDVAYSLEYKSIQEVSEALFLDVFEKSVIDYEESDGLNGKEYFNFLKELAEDKYDENSWYIVCDENIPIGVLLPQVFADNEKEGTIFFIGLIKEFRNKRFATEMHLKGLNDLYSKGVATYYGSTLISNYAMFQVFKKNNCDVEATQNYFELLV
jgi:RimJ/RimL family protein N-acetyltransferase